MNCCPKILRGKVDKFKKLKPDFFRRSTLEAAKDLLGKYLTVKRKGKILAGKIVETEAYISEDDLACHASKGRTNRSETLYQKAGTIYVYLVYGMYHCLNIVTEREYFPSAVLIRAVEPVEGVDIMKKLRKTGVLHNLASGPGKLCVAFGISKKMRGKDVFGDEIYIEDRGEKIAKKNIARAKRIGVDYAGACAHYPWRFYIKGIQFISKK